MITVNVNNVIKMTSLERCNIRKVTVLAPIVRSTTRWSSTYTMLKQFFELSDYSDETDSEIAVLLPPVMDVIMLQDLINHLKKFEPVTKRLQPEDTDVSVVRTLSDKLLENYHEMEHFLGRSNCSLTHYAIFEIGLFNAVCGLPLSSE